MKKVDSIRIRKFDVKFSNTAVFDSSILGHEISPKRLMYMINQKDPNYRFKGVIKNRNLERVVSFGVEFDEG